MRDFWAISLCNIVHKLVTKVLSNRLKSLLVHIVLEFQSAFMSGHLIIDYILIAYKIFYVIHGDNRVGGGMAIISIFKSL